MAMLQLSNGILIGQDCVQPPGHAGEGRSKGKEHETNDAEYTDWLLTLVPIRQVVL